ncbi:MAG: ribosome maturation factor RimM [Lachnospiraceae bacterium]
MEELLQVGVITSTHGIGGEVKVFPTTDDVARFKTLKEVILDTGKEKKTLEITNVKFFKKFAILKFKEINSINEAELYKTKPLYVTREHAVALGKDEYFIADLIGMEVVDEHQQALGTLQDVMQTGANDVYIVQMSAGKEVLIPAIKECILEVSMDAKRMTVHLLDGLLE